MQRVKKVLMILFTACGLLLASTMLMVALASPWWITNIDDSLPGKVYRIERGTLPGKNEIAALRAPSNPYYPKDAPFLKIILGVPGDLVTRDGESYFINGQFIGKAKRETHGSFPLTPGPTGTIPNGHYFIWTPHPDSYDSRYGEIGWIEQNRIIGRARRIL